MALYKNTGIGLRANQHDWGEITMNKESGEIYLHVFNWPLDRVLRVSGLKSSLTKAELLNENGADVLAFEQNGPLLHITLPAEGSDPFNSIIRLTAPQLSIDNQIVAESTFGGFALHSTNVSHSDDIKMHKYDGKNPNFLEINSGNATWEVYFPNVGKYQLDLSAHNPNKTRVAIEIEIDGVQYEASLSPDGLVVAEPNENNYTEEFTDRAIATVEIASAGKHTVKFVVKDEQPIWLNRIWIAPLTAD